MNVNLDALRSQIEEDLKSRGMLEDTLVVWAGETQTFVQVGDGDPFSVKLTVPVSGPEPVVSLTVAL